MPRRKKMNLRVKYYSTRLQDKLSEMLEARTTYIEAPSGYGKTTAVSEYFPQSVHSGQKVFWFTVLENEVPERSWERFCRQIAQIDKKAGNNLQALGIPDEDTIGDIADSLSQIFCEQNTYLVIDNLQYWMETMPRDILPALAEHGGERLHIIMISQPVQDEVKFMADSSILRIGKADFMFDANAIREYFLKAGIGIAIDDALAIWNKTEGWIAAIYLELLQFGDTHGTLCTEHDIYVLMRSVVWDRLNMEEQKLLLLLSPFSCFTRQQLLFMMDENEMPAYCRHLFGGMGFIRYDQRHGMYYPHTILLELLRQLFLEKNEEYRRQVWIRAGQWNEKTGDKLSAVKCYYKARDFERLYALKLKDVELHTADGGNAIQAIEDMIDSCPQEVKLQYPLTLISFAYKLFFAARYARFLSLCDEISALILKTAFDEREKERLFGELAMVKSFSVYNDIQKMSEQHLLAYRLIGGHARTVDISAPWTMGCPSVLYMFHRSAGELSRELSCMERCLPAYIKLAAGHGSGAELIMKAESLFFGGCWGEADILALRASYTANIHRQYSLQLCAEYLLARCALANGNADSFCTAIKHMEQIAYKGPPSMLAALDMATAHLCLIINHPEEIASWLKEGNFGSKGVLYPAVPYAQMLHLYYCLHTKQYRLLYSLADIFLSNAERQHVLVPQI